MSSTQSAFLWRSRWLWTWRGRLIIAEVLWLRGGMARRGLKLGRVAVPYERWRRAEEIVN